MGTVVIDGDFLHRLLAELDARRTGKIKTQWAFYRVRSRDMRPLVYDSRRGAVEARNFLMERGSECTKLMRVTRGPKSLLRMLGLGPRSSSSDQTPPPDDGAQ